MDNESHKASPEQHLAHLCTELQRYNDQHGEYEHWTSEEQHWHDLLVDRVNEEDGYNS